LIYLEFGRTVKALTFEFPCDYVVLCPKCFTEIGATLLERMLGAARLKLATSALTAF
jgi:hypothetical protein